MTINPIIIETIDYLNDVNESSYLPDDPLSLKLLNGLIRDGYSLEDFKKVIDNKYSDWKGTIYQEYIRPETLFGKKFKYYLNAKPRITKTGIYKLADAVNNAKQFDWRMDSNPRTAHISPDNGRKEDR